VKETFAPPATEPEAAGFIEESSRRAWGAALAACLVALAAVGGFFLLRYVRKGYRFPVGWDAPFYVWRINAVTFDGLARIGAIRAATPLVFASLMRATGQNSLTMVAIVPAVLCALVGLSGAAMARVASGMRAMWVPVVALLTWTAFGDIGIVNGHLDNLLNAAFIVGGFAAACAFAGSRRGVVAVAVLFMAAALAEWPFYAFAMGVFLVGLALFCVPVLLRREGLREPLPLVGPLLGATAVSVVFTGLTFLAVPTLGGIGVRVNRPGSRAILRRRFIDRLHQTIRYWAFPLAGMGAFLLARPPRAGGRRPARTLFLCLMAAWMLTTIVAGAAQLAGVPVAGGRLLSFLFAVPILTGVFVSLVATGAARRYGTAGVAAGVGIAIAAVALFGVAAYRRINFRPWMEPDAVHQVASTGVYLHRFAPDRDVVFILRTAGRRDNVTMGRWWHVVRAILPADQVPRAHRFIGSPAEYLNARRLDAAPHPADNRAVPSRDTEASVIQAYNPSGFDEAVSNFPGRMVAPGVVALDGPVPEQVLLNQPSPQAATTPRDLVVVSALVVLVLFLAGWGWAGALLPADPVVRTALAPVIGTAVLALVALAWSVIGLHFGRVTGLGPLAVTAVAGWMAVWARGRVFRGRAFPGRPEVSDLSES
jgi:hypothetical protein